MEENKEQEELNNLSREGRINVDDIKNDSTFSEKSIKPDSIEQIIDEDSLLEAANKNSIYTNMLEPCSMEGINITKRLKKYFEENKVKPEDLVEEIRRQMSVIRKDINQHTQNLFFDESGKINVEISIEKARKNGAKIPNYIKAIDEEIPNKASEEDKIESFLINGVDVYKQLEDKSEEFWQNLQKEMDDRFKKIDEENNIDEVVSKIDEEKSDKNKEFKAELLNVKNMLKNMSAPKTMEEKGEYTLKIMYIYQKYKELNLDEIEGLSDEKKSEIANCLNGLKDIIKYSFSEVTSLDIEKAKVEDVVRNLGFSEKQVKELWEKFNAEFKDETSKQRGNDKSYSELNKENKEELEKRDIIRRIKLYKTFSELPSTLEIFNQIREFTNSNPEKLINIVYQKIEKKYPGIMDEIDKEYEQDNLMPIYAEIIKRNHLFKNFSEFEKVKDTSDEKALKEEYSIITDAIDFVCRENIYGAIGKKFSEDVKCNDQAFEIIKDVFPEVIFQDYYNKPQIDFQKLMLLYKERYSFIPKIEKINDITSFVGYTRMKTAVKLGVATAKIALDRESGNQKSITEILKDKEILKEVQEKSEIQEKLVIREKRFSILAKEISKILEKGKILDSEEEVNLVKYLAIIIKEYSDEPSSEKNALYKTAKTKLSDFLPGVYDDKSIFHAERLEEEFLKYLQKNGKQLDNPTDFFETEIRKLDESIKKSYIKEELKRNPRVLAEKISKENMESIIVLNKKQEQEKILKFVTFIKKANRNREIVLTNSSTSVALEQIEERVKQNLEEIFSDRENGKREAEEFFSKKDSYSHDEDIVQSMIRNVRREYGLKNKVLLGKKYNKEDRITDKDDIKKVLTIYLGTKNDTRNSILNREKNNITHKSFINLLKKISPELVQKNDVNKDALLKFYNQTYHTDFADIEEVYSIEESKILESIVDELNEEICNPQKEYYEAGTMAGIITSNELEIHNNLQADACRKRYTQITSSMELMAETQKILTKEMKEGLSKEEEIELLKKSVSVIALINDEKKMNPRIELSKFESKYLEFREKSIEILKGNIEKFFWGISPEDGMFDLETISQKCEEYFIENGIPINKKEGQSVVDVFLEEFNYKKENTFGPNIPRKILERTMQKRIEDMDSALKEWEEFKIKDAEMIDISWEEIDTSSLEMDTFTHKEIHVASDEYDKDEFPSPTEAVNEIRVEEIKVSTQDIPSQDVANQEISSKEDLNMDNHPTVIEKSNLFTKTIKILGRFIKDRINSLRNGSSSNDGRTPSVIPIQNIDRNDAVKKLTGYGVQEIDFSKVQQVDNNSNVQKHLNAEISRDDD